MPAAIEGRARELLEGANFCYIGTNGADGWPWVNPIWVHLEGDLLVVNSSEGRKWPENVRRDPKVTLCVPDKDNPYEYVTVWGRVVEDTHEGALENINFLAKKYMDKDEYPFLQPGEQRILFRIEPERVQHYGG
jgi:PPOX class probable F420-dependent enzyme